MISRLLYFQQENKSITTGVRRDDKLYGYNLFRWSHERSKRQICSILDRFITLYHQSRLDFWYIVYRNRKTTVFDFSFYSKSSGLVKNRTYVLNLINDIEIKQP